MSLLLTGRNQDRLDATAQEIRRAAPRTEIETIAADLSTRSGVSALLDRVGDRPIECLGEKSERLVGTIGDRQALGQIVKADDWNQYTVIARGGPFLHIINGQLMAVMVDDDPASSNNWSGLFGIEIEATTKVSVRNIWVKKLR